jgi:hypothetical protein
MAEEELTLAQQIAAGEENLAALRAQAASEAWDGDRAAEVLAFAQEALAACATLTRAGVAITFDPEQRDEAWVVLDLSSLLPDSPSTLERNGVRFLVADVVNRFKGKNPTDTTVRVSAGKLYTVVGGTVDEEGVRTGGTAVPQGPLLALEQDVA